MQLKQPKDLGQQLNSVYGIKYLWLNWSIIGIHPPEQTKKHFVWCCLYYMYSAVINFLGAFCLPASMLANLFFVETWEEVIGNLSVSFNVVFSTLKELVVLKHRQRLLQMGVLLQKLDVRCNTHPRDRMNILNAVRKCHAFYMIYFTCYIFCACGFAYIGWSNHQLVYNAYFPTLFGNRPEANYIAAFIYQNMAQTFTIFQNGTNDIYPLCYVNLMNAHLEALSGRIARIGNGAKEVNIKDNVDELLQCIQDHKHILSYFEGISPVISATLFLQFIITAFVLCLTAVNLIAFERNLTQQFFAIFYLVLIMTQVLPSCWYVNVLMEKSDYLTTAMYSCNWIDQNQLFRKMLIIFMQRTQKSNVILAGNLAPVTLQTFLVIIRFSFSMFTIFSKMKI